MPNDKDDTKEFAGTAGKAYRSGGEFPLCACLAGSTKTEWTFLSRGKAGDNVTKVWTDKDKKKCAKLPQTFAGVFKVSEDKTTAILTQLKNAGFKPGKDFAKKMKNIFKENGAKIKKIIINPTEGDPIVDEDEDEVGVEVQPDQPPQPDPDTSNPAEVWLKLQAEVKAQLQAAITKGVLPKDHAAVKLWSKALGQAKAEDFTGAVTSATAVKKAILQAASAKTNGQDATQEQWETAKTKVQPKLLEALKTGAGDPNRLKIEWAHANKLAEEQAYAKAIAHLSGAVMTEINKALQEHSERGDQGYTEAQKAMGDTSKQYVEVLKKWIKAREEARQTIIEFENTIVKELVGTEFEDSIDAVPGSLQAHLRVLGKDVEDAFAAYLKTSPDRRGGALQNIRGVVMDYRNRLSTGFFAEIDDNGLVDLTVSQDLNAAMDEIEDVINAG